MKKVARKITPKEIPQLYQFTRKHYVEYYDVQTELVDHLASAIEDRWKEHPNLGFDENLREEFKKFGVFGFMEVVENRQAAMQKKYLKLIWRETKTLLKRPKMLLLLMILFVLCRFLLETASGFSIVYGGVVALAVFQLFYLLKLEVLLRKKKKSTGKIYLLEELIFKAGGISTGFLLPFYVLNGLSSATFLGNPFLQLLLAFLISVMVSVSYICFYELPRKKKEILQKAHPELKFCEINP